MSQQAPQGPNGQYSAPGYQQGASAMDTQYAQPPAKRQRLSPPAPGYNNSAYRPTQTSPVQAQSGYGNPYAQTHTPQPQYSPVYNGQHQQFPQNSFNSPEPYSGNRSAWQPPSQHAQRPQNATSPSSSQMMPPPPKPVREEREEKVGVDDINDALFSSGINLKDEENYMHNLYNNRHTGNDSFASHQGSFGSSTASQGGSFGLTQGTSFSTQPNGVGAGTIGGAVTEQSVEQELKHKRTATARRKAEADQHQLKNPFILGNVMRIKMEKISKEQGVRLNTDGLYLLKNEETRVATNGTDGMVVAKAGSCVESNAPLADVISLLSLASGERVRGLLDESYGLARARRYADHGRVPIDFKDIAVGSGLRQNENIVPENITGSPWDQPETATDQPQTTISFQSAINNQLQTLAQRDQDAEKARVAKREARRKAQEAALANGVDVGMTASQDNTATSTTPAGDAAQPVKVTKKELARQQKEKASFTEAQAATTINQTAAMMALGKKGNKYSWMSGGAASMPTNRFAKATPVSTPGSGAATPTKKDAHAPGVKKDANAGTAGLSWGQWRENSAGGRGIQTRDWVLVLERDGKHKKAWERALLRQGTPTTDTKAN